MFDSVGTLFQANSYANLGAGSALAGAILVSSPIIIHLINRMRFKRIRWAAMEFLLKAQKRMRRKMIIEQLLLLLLRILMVFLVGLLISRFVGCGTAGQEARTTAHVVLLDDSPSMADALKTEEGQNSEVLEQAKKMIYEQIVPAAAQATTPQLMDVMLLSDLNQPLVFNRLSDTSATEIKDKLSSRDVSTVRVPLHEGLLKARDRLESTGSSGDTARVLHVISDFRSADWAENGQAIRDAIEMLNKSGIRVHLIDLASPYRTTERKVPQSNDNLAIVDLQPAKPVVARFEPVEFTLKVHNFGVSDMSNKRFAIKINGDESKVPSRTIATILPGQTYTEKFTATFDRVASPDKPFDRFSLITVALAEEEGGGLQIDNVRHAVVEVRDRLPILVIDGNPELREKREGNSLYLQRYFTGAGGGYQWIPGDVRDLEKADLAKYSFVLVLNVPSLPESAVQSLEKYLRGGGGCAFFLGANIKPADYNKFLYRDGEGCFPVPLPDNPSKELTEEEKFQKEFSVVNKKLLIRDTSAKQHPALFGLYTDERGQPSKDVQTLEKFFDFVGIFRYWPVKRPGKWTQDPNTRELYCLPNEESIANYEKQAIDLANAIVVPPKDETKPVDALHKALTQLKSDIPATARGAVPLWRLGELLDRLLSDQRATGDPEELALRDYWSLSENADLKIQVQRLRDIVKYGDPLYLAKNFGKGRVITFLSSPGEAWNNWASKQPGSATFPPIMKEMSTYLSSGGNDPSLACGTPIELALDPAGFKPDYRVAFLTHKHDPKAGLQPGANAAPMTEPRAMTTEAEKIKVRDGDKEIEKDSLVARYKDTIKMGAYLFELKQIVPGSTPTDAPAEALVYKAVAVNVDAEREGNLQRVSSDDVAQNAPQVPFHSPDDTKWIDTLKRKKSDLSEIGYLFAILLLILVAEQAMSVRLSYHSSADTLSNLAPTIATAMQRSTGAASPAEATPAA